MIVLRASQEINQNQKSCLVRFFEYSRNIFTRCFCKKKKQLNSQAVFQLINNEFNQRMNTLHQGIQSINNEFDQGIQLINNEFDHQEIQSINNEFNQRINTQPINEMENNQIENMIEYYSQKPTIASA